MTRRILAGLAATVAVLGVSCAHERHDTAHTPQACAKRLHVAYSPDQGATERLRAFSACVGYACYAERSDTTEGVEIIAYPPGTPRTRPGVAVGCPR